MISLSIDSIEDSRRALLLEKANERLGRYPLTRDFLLPAVEKAIGSAKSWIGLAHPHVRVAASPEKGDSQALDFLESGLKELQGVEGLERLTRRLQDNPTEYLAIAAEMHAATQLKQEKPGCSIRFRPSTDGPDLALVLPDGSDALVEVKKIRDLEVFSLAHNYLAACSFLDPRFIAFFSFRGTELLDDDFESKRRKVEEALQGWVQLLNQRIVAGEEATFNAVKGGIPEYPFESVEVLFRWGRLSVGAGGIARILTGSEPSGVARELVRLGHLPRLVNQICKAYRQLDSARGGPPRPTDQIRVYGCIPENLLGLLEQHEVSEVLEQIRSIIRAWGIDRLVEVHLFPQ